MSMNAINTRLLGVSESLSLRHLTRCNLDFLFVRWSFRVGDQGLRCWLADVRQWVSDVIDREKVWSSVRENSCTEAISAEWTDRKALGVPPEPTKFGPWKNTDPQRAPTEIKRIQGNVAVGGEIPANRVAVSRFSSLSSLRVIVIGVPAPNITPSPLYGGNSEVRQS